MITTQPDIIRLAREADCQHVNLTGDHAKAVERLTRFSTLVIADFLHRTGQYVTNDASRETAITEALQAMTAERDDALYAGRLIVQRCDRLIAELEKANNLEAHRCDHITTLKSNCDHMEAELAALKGQEPVATVAEVDTDDGTVYAVVDLHSLVACGDKLYRATGAQPYDQQALEPCISG